MNRIILMSSFLWTSIALAMNSPSKFALFNEETNIPPSSWDAPPPLFSVQGFIDASEEARDFHRQHLQYLTQWTQNTCALWENLRNQEIQTGQVISQAFAWLQDHIPYKLFFNQCYVELDQNDRTIFEQHKPNSDSIALVYSIYISRYIVAQVIQDYTLYKAKFQDVLNTMQVDPRNRFNEILNYSYALKKYQESLRYSPYLTLPSWKQEQLQQIKEIKELISHYLDFIVSHALFYQDLHYHEEESNYLTLIFNLHKQQVLTWSSHEQALVESKPERNDSDTHLVDAAIRLAKDANSLAQVATRHTIRKTNTTVPRVITPTKSHPAREISVPPPSHETDFPMIERASSLPPRTTAASLGFFTAPPPRRSTQININVPVAAEEISVIEPVATTEQEMITTETTLPETEELPPVKCWGRWCF